MMARFRRRLVAPVALLVLALAICACEEEAGLAPDAGPGQDRGPDTRDGGQGDGALPQQACTDGLATTHLMGPVTSSLPPATPDGGWASGGGVASSPAAAPLAGGGRGLSTELFTELVTAHLDPLVQRRAGTTGCLALARLDQPAWQRLRALGIRPVERTRPGTFVVALAPGSRPREALDRGLAQSLDRLRPADKLPPAAPGAPASARALEGRVALVADAHGRVLRMTLAQLGLPVSAAGERAAARLRWVFRVAAAASPPLPLDADARRSVRTEDVQQADTSHKPPVYAGYTGEGVVVSVLDTGVDPAHLDLHAFDSAGKDLGTRVVSLDAKVDNHGTAVASVVAGNGHGSAAYKHDGQLSTPYQWRGHAPRVTKVVSILSSNLAKLKQAIADHGSHLSNHSYVQSYGTYNNIARDVDAAIRDGVIHAGKRYPGRPMIWAVGNQGITPQYGKLRGYYSCYAVAKNPIVVGGTNANDDAFSPWSAMGPTFDGRIKPDVVAPSRKDYRPPGGVLTEIDEIRLVARPGAGAKDVVWSFTNTGDLQGWKTDPGISKVKVSGGALQALITDGGEGGVKITRTGLSVDGSKYDRVTLRLRLQLKEVPGRYRWPRFWVISWDRDADPQFDDTIYPVFEAGKKDGAWQVHTAKLPAKKFSGTIKALQLWPVVYDDRIVVAAPNSQTYRLFTGTSLSAPVVSGVVALLLHQYKKQKGVDLATAPPAPSTIKALLVHTARDLVHQKADPRDRNNPDTKSPVLLPPGPDFASGYGLVDARAASELLRASGPKARKILEASISSTQVHSFRVALSPNVTFRSLKATLAWDDAPGSPTLGLTEVQLVNDLDLVAISPSGKAYGPWVLDPLPLNKQTLDSGYDPIKPSDVKAARRCVTAAEQKDKTCEDHRNNVEQVLVDNPESGWWTIKVRAGKLTAGPQRYSLVATASCE